MIDFVAAMEGIELREAVLLADWYSISSEPPAKGAPSRCRPDAPPAPATADKPAEPQKQDTGEGEPLDYEAVSVPDLPLLEVPQAWGISIKAVPGNFRYYGYYSGGKKR